MDYTQSIGNINELQCMLAFIELGYDCSIPYGNASKYDFIVDIEGQLIRIQCKSSRHPTRDGVLDTDAFMFNTCSATTNTKKTVRHKYNKEQIDYFATCFNGKVYVIPVEECSSAKTLRFSPPNNGTKNYNKAEDYLISNLFSESSLYQSSKESYLNREIIGKIETPREYSCSQCGAPVSSKGALCTECAKEKSRKVERPTRENLKDLIRTKSFTQIGKMFGVADNTIRKWCIAYNLPSRISEINKISDDEWLNI